MESETEKKIPAIFARPIEEPKGDEPLTPGSQPVPDTRKTTKTE